MVRMDIAMVWCTLCAYQFSEMTLLALQYAEPVRPELWPNYALPPQALKRLSCESLIHQEVDVATNDKHLLPISTEAASWTTTESILSSKSWAARHLQAALSSLEALLEALLPNWSISCAGFLGSSTVLQVSEPWDVCMHCAAVSDRSLRFCRLFWYIEPNLRTCTQIGRCGLTGCLWSSTQ